MNYTRAPVMIKDVMRKMRWQQNKLAAAIDCSPQYLSDILLGRRAISVEMACRLGVLGNGITTRTLLVAQLDEELENCAYKKGRPEGDTP